MENRSFRVVLLGAALLGAALGGCGSGASERSEVPETTPAPQRTPASGPTFRGDPRPARSNARATLEPLLQAWGVIHVAAGEGIVAVTMGDVSGAGLYVAPATFSGPLRLRPVRAAGTVPYWAPIHVGRDASGEPVVAVPRCTGEAYATCTPMVWSSATGQLTPVRGFERAGGALEVAVDRGNAAILATTDPDARKQDDGTSAGAEPRAWVSAEGGRARRLDRPGPRHIALHGDTLATISDTGGDDGLCGEQVAQLWTVDDPAATPREVGTQLCGLAGMQFVSAQLDADRARFVVNGNQEDGHAELLTYDGASGTATRRRMGAGTIDVAWISRRVGIATSPPGSPDCDGFIDTSGGDPDPLVGPCALGRITLKGDL